MSDEMLVSMFVKGADDKWRFHLGETERHECKEGFGFRHSEKWLRAVAALANNEGGYVVLGVKDKSLTNGIINSDSYLAKGMSSSEFENADPADFSMKLKSTFDPTPRIETKCIHLDGAKIGIIYVHKHPGRPVITTKGEGRISEGDIFFRYPGQSSRIKYSDLQTILEDRDRRVREQMLPLVEELIKLGPRNAMIADLSKGELRGDNGTILIGEHLVEKIKFIKEGEFREKEGAPALMLIGEVSPVGAGTVTVQKTFVTVNSIIDDFLEQQTPFEPRDYIRCAVEAGNGAWLPMHYFARGAGLNSKQVESLIMSCSAPSSRREVNRDSFLVSNQHLAEHRVRQELSLARCIRVKFRRSLM
ncbi:ATP-binding protein [Paracoccus sp. (in: a-proteobacteria)]|uniref:ATP-binding protein n=1 Tax=Paracoccus sp. TaxID=267 RepID=UPI002AFDD707|nr:ATP-binding protein [Paracoccus sp. (in: a-proteobacteria)]